MKRFAEMFAAVDATTSTNDKVAALQDYFRNAPPADAAWAVYFLTGQKLQRVVATRALRDWTIAVSGIPEWLFDESYSAVGDLAEVIALLVHDRAPDSPRNDQTRRAEDFPLHRWIDERILPLRGQNLETQRAAVLRWWQKLDRNEIFLLNKLVTGELRVGVSRTLLLRALAQVAGVAAAVVAHRLMGTWQPTAAAFEALVRPESNATAVSQPYPFYLASPLEAEASTLGPSAEWIVEWKWDGIRAQVVRRAGDLFIWSRGEELVTGRFPELHDAAMRLPDGTVLDGEIIALQNGEVAPFTLLQRRIGRDVLSERVLREAPVGFIAYDVLESGGGDVRHEALEQRRLRLEELIEVAGAPFRVSAQLAAPGWEAFAQLRSQARENKVEGLMLKRRASMYGSGRKRGDWWKWKIAPYTVDAVLVYAQPGHGKRASLFTDYTFGVWHNGELVPVAKAYSGLSNDEILQLDRWIRNHTLERFGPVRRVAPEHVFEIAFEAIQRSTRHRSGIALRFPRIHRWRTDKPVAEADSLQSLQRLLGE